MLTQVLNSCNLSVLEEMIFTQTAKNPDLIVTSIRNLAYMPIFICCVGLLGLITVKAVG